MPEGAGASAGTTAQVGRAMGQGARAEREEQGSTGLGKGRETQVKDFRLHSEDNRMWLKHSEQGIAII